LPAEWGARKAIVEAEDLEGPAYQTCINAAANETALWDRPPERQVPMTAARLFEKEPERAAREASCKTRWKFLTGARQDSWQ
jgi:hypothetical protein